MRLTLSDVIVVGSFIGWFLAYMKAKRKWVKWLFGVVCIIALIAACWPSQDNKRRWRLEGTTIIGSVGQQGGQTFQTIIMTNSTSASAPKLTGAYIAKNVPSGEKYITTVNLHLDSAHPVTLTLVARGRNIQTVTLSRVGSPVTSGLRGGGEGFRSFTMENAYGDLVLTIVSTTPEEFQLQPQIH